MSNHKSGGRKPRADVQPRVLAQLARGPQKCVQIAEALGLRKKDVTTALWHLSKRGAVHGHQETSRHHTYIWALTATVGAACELERVWPMPMTLPAGIAGTTHRGAM